jgi:hypothetical protein
LGHLSRAGYWEPEIHAVYSMSRTGDKQIANGSCGLLPSLEDDFFV